MTTVYLNGEFLPIEQAKVSVMDRGFLFGDGVYEVIPVYDGHVFCPDGHLKRLQASLKAIKLSLDTSLSEWHTLIKQLITKNGGGDLLIYLQITRGPEANRHHAFPTNPQPTIFLRTTAYQPASIEDLAQGIKVVTASDTRWQNCYIKSISLLPNILLYQQALEHNAQETILLNEHAYVVEGASSNVFIVEKGTVITPPKDPHILGGITRQFILQLAKNLNIPYEERMISDSELRQADEIWISSSSREVKPVLQLDQQTVGAAKAGPVWQQIIAAYKAAIKNLAKEIIDVE